MKTTPQDTATGATPRHATWLARMLTLFALTVLPATSQAIEREDVLNIGGFSDDVFKIIAAFAAGQLGAGHWVGEIEAI